MGAPVSAKIARRVGVNPLCTEFRCSLASAEQFDQASEISDVASKVLAGRAKDHAYAKLPSIMDALIIHQAVLKFEFAAFRNGYVAHGLIPC